ncbi:MAG: metallophosphoesterase family protein, partial [Peptostreptococcaceae bacterium]|nr:metallophosphoesterase family protein [Peptostreptococcaceae bacterium]
MIIGLISDTHGLIRAEVINNLQGCDLILHAGDVGKNDIIERIKK